VIGGTDGLIEGNEGQMVDQIVAMAVVAVYSFGVTGIILKVLDLTLGLRPSEDEERLGLDVTQHGERAYVFDEGGLVPVPAAAPATPPPPAPPAEPEGAQSG
jgi:ammonia channel protein AmtB